MNGQTAHKVGCPLITPGIYGRFPRCTCGDAPTEMASLTQIKSRLAAIEEAVNHNQGAILGRLEEIRTSQQQTMGDAGALAERLDKLYEDNGLLESTVCERLDEVLKFARAIDDGLASEFQRASDRWTAIYTRFDKQNTKLDMALEARLPSKQQPKRRRK